MKKIICILFLIIGLFGFSQENTDNKAFKDGEFLKYRMHYGVINAGYATVEVDEINKNNIDQYHVTGKGWTTGMLRWVFPVKDNYQSFINKTTMEPLLFIRRVKEGGHRIERDIHFKNDTAFIEDHKYKTKSKAAAKNVQDMISSFYYLRNQDVEKLAVNESIEIDMFFDGKANPFKLIKLGEETLKTKFGHIKCYKFRPLVYKGRVFKENESLTIWISADKNKIPVRMQADLRVGSLKADLHEYKGLSHPMPIVFI